MSFEITACEKLTIDNTDVKALPYIDCLINYIDGINKMSGVESLDILSLILSADGKTAEVKEQHETEYGNGYTVDENGFRERSAEREIFGKDHPLINLLSTLREAKNIEFYNRFSSMCLLSENLGREYWRETLKDDITARKYVKYKATEYYDTSPEVEIVAFGEDGLADLSQCRVKTEDVDDIRQWFSYSYEIYLNVDDTEGKESLYETVMNNLNEIIKVTSDGEDGPYTPGIDSCWEDYGEISLGNSITIKTPVIGVIKSCLQNIYDEVQKYDGVMFECILNAVPDGEGDYDFAALSITEKDGAIDASVFRV